MIKNGKVFFSAGLLFSCLIWTPKTWSANFCLKVDERLKKEISSRYSQDPFNFAANFLKVSKMADGEVAQNKLMQEGFDLKAIYFSSKRNLKSTLVSKKVFDWLSYQYFGNLKKLYVSKEPRLVEAYYDLMTGPEREALARGDILVTSYKKVKCNAKEKSLLGCKSGLHVVTLQNSNGATCLHKKLQKPMQVDLYLSHDAYYGFKVIDIKVSGKRIVMDSMDHLLALKRRGFNDSALYNHIALLAPRENTFKIPRKVPPTKLFLTKVRQMGRQEERLPSSL